MTTFSPLATLATTTSSSPRQHGSHVLGRRTGVGGHGRDEIGFGISTPPSPLLLEATTMHDLGAHVCMEALIGPKSGLFGVRAAASAPDRAVR